MKPRPCGSFRLSHSLPANLYKLYCKKRRREREISPPQRDNSSLSGNLHLSSLWFPSFLQEQNETVTLTSHFDVSLPQNGISF